MGINLTFAKGFMPFMVVIRDRNIWWNDKRSGLQMMYPNPSPKAIEVGGKPTEEDLREYNLCKTEAELASFIIRDCLKAGIKLINKEETNETQT